MEQIELPAPTATKSNQPSLDELRDLIVHEIPPELAEALDLQVEPIRNEEAARASNFVLVRHGYSIFNHMTDKLRLDDITMEDQRAMPVLLDPRQMDSDLHTIGIYQSLKQQSFINELSFKVVFVSPLKRALETTYLMFKNHPQRAQIRFVVLPYLTETIGMSSALAFDTLYGIREVYSNQLEGGIKFDFSMFDSLKHPRVWFLEVLQNKAKSEALIAEIESMQCQDDDAIAGKILDTFRATFPKRFESRDDLYKRVLVSKEILLKYLAESYGEDVFKDGSKVGIVAHAVFLRCFTSEGVIDGEVQGGIRFKNCEIGGTNF